MPDFKLCVAVRDPNGMLTDPLHEEVITAADAVGAAAQAKTLDLDMAQLKANALYLVDANGYVVWSLRIADMGRPGD